MLHLRIRNATIRITRFNYLAFMEKKTMDNRQNNPYVKSPAYTWYVLGGPSASYTHFVVTGMNPFKHNAPKHFRFNNKQDAYNFMIKENKKVIADWSTMN